MSLKFMQEKSSKERISAMNVLNLRLTSYQEQGR